MKTVYVSQDVMVRQGDGELHRKFDLSSAEKYGTIVTLIPHGQSIASTVPVVRQLLEQLRNFDDNDYLLPLGDPAIMAAAAAIAAKRNADRLKILKWDRRAAGYVVVQLDFSGKTL